MNNLTTQDVAIAILNWNGLAHLKKFLPSVVHHSGEANIYVIDNGSTDDSIAFLKETFPEIHIIQNNQNYGFSGGYNEGLKGVAEPILVLLNNDIEVTQNWLIPIIEEFNQNLETAIIQPKILDYNKKDTFEYAGAAGGHLDTFGFPFCRGRLFNHIEKDHKQYNDRCDIFWASGASFAIKNDVFKKLKGFDPLYFAHHEEIDLCWRTLNLGYRIKFIPHSTVYHLGGGTLSYENPKKIFLNFRNSLFSLLKNYPKKGLIKTIFLRLIIDGGATLFFTIQMKPKLSIQLFLAHMNFYKHFFKLYRERRYIKPKVYPSFKGSIIQSFFLYKKKTYSEVASKTN